MTNLYLLDAIKQRVMYQVDVQQLKLDIGETVLMRDIVMRRE